VNAPTLAYGMRMHVAQRLWRGGSFSLRPPCGLTALAADPIVSFFLSLMTIVLTIQIFFHLKQLAVS